MFSEWEKKPETKSCKYGIKEIDRLCTEWKSMMIAYYGPFLVFSVLFVFFCDMCLHVVILVNRLRLKIKS